MEYVAGPFEERFDGLRNIHGAHFLGANTMERKAHSYILDKISDAINYFTFFICNDAKLVAT